MHFFNITDVTYSQPVFGQGLQQNGKKVTVVFVHNRLFITEPDFAPIFAKYLLISYVTFSGQLNISHLITRMHNWPLFSRGVHAYVCIVHTGG